MNAWPCCAHASDAVGIGMAPTIFCTCGQSSNAHFVRERKVERDARLVARKAFRRTRHEARGARSLPGTRRLGCGAARSSRAHSAALRRGSKSNSWKKKTFLIDILLLSFIHSGSWKLWGAPSTLGSALETLDLGVQTADKAEQKETQDLDRKRQTKRKRMGNGRPQDRSRETPCASVSRWFHIHLIVCYIRILDDMNDTIFV